MNCAYCLTRRAVQTDHMIKKAQARRSARAQNERENPRFKVRVCHECNMAVYTRNRVPVSHAHLIPELEAITGGVYATYDGNPESLREVIR